MIPRRKRMSYSSRRQRVEEAGGLVVRSGWEANIARMLVWLKRRGDVVRWSYEPKTFRFTKDAGVTTKKGTEYKMGPYSYTPDFEILWKGETTPELWEVKGRTHKGDKTRLARFRKHYPAAASRLLWIGPTQYKTLEKTWRLVIPGWKQVQRRTKKRTRLGRRFTDDELLELAGKGSGRR
jgi:hypothetical protein